MDAAGCHSFHTVLVFPLFTTHASGNNRESAGPESTLRDWGRRVPDARKWNQYIASAMKLIETDDRIALHAQQQVPLVAVHPFSIGLIQSSFARDFSITVSTEISTYRYS